MQCPIEASGFDNPFKTFEEEEAYIIDYFISKLFK
jgi:hypothetical protein